MVLWHFTTLCAEGLTNWRMGEQESLSLDDKAYEQIYQFLCTHYNTILLKTSEENTIGSHNQGMKSKLIKK